MRTLSADTEELTRRIDELERRTAALTEALLALVHGLEGTPLNENERMAMRQAAHRAHEALLAAGIRSG